MRKNKKGQESGQAVAVLILVIGLFIVLYILLLPPEERRDILNVEEGTENGVLAKTILSESPGIIKPSTERTTEHEISSLNLFVKSQPDIDFLSDSLVIKRSWFGRYFPKIKFEILDLENLNKASLYFRVVDSKGTLRIWMNGEEFYSETISDSDIKIIDIPLHLLEDVNEIKFGIDVPFAFWNPNKYTLQDVSFKKEYNLINKQEKRLFSISSDEKDRLKTVELSYFMYCNMLNTDSTNLKVSLNSREIFSGLVKCVGTRDNLEIDPKDLRKGTNELLFEIKEGDFLFSDIFIKTDYRGVNYPIYYFTLEEDDYNNLQNEDVDALLELKFGSSGDKNARILINNNEIILRSSSDSFKRNINSMIENGDNFVKIIPSNTFTIDSLKIGLE